jgi:alkylhydroperoxidase/carboxymuconolactone decarboxylase family protein YurZ
VERIPMRSEPKPPRTYEAFIKRFPRLHEVWEALAEAGKEGPLDEKRARLIKLAVAVGALREGAIHASVRKALAGGTTVEEIEQVIALAAGTIGMPATVAVFSWVEDLLRPAGPRRKK